MAKERVVITGLGAVTPLGLTAASSWEAARAGKSGVGQITRFDASQYTTTIAAEVTGFDPTAYQIEPKEVKKLDLFSQYALAAAQEAWDQSKLASSTTPRSRFGCILGIGVGGLGTLEKYHKVLLEEGPRRVSPFLIPAMISNLGPGNIGIRFGLKGPNFTVTSACTSANHALGESFRMISEGVQDVILSGGTEAAIVPLGIGGFCALKALSTRNDAPEKASRPFDSGRDGFVMGEGAVVLVLESLRHAEARGATIFAEVVGYGASCDAYHITAPSVDGEGAVACMRDAITSAGLHPTQIGYVNAHGTSTPANDSSETAAIKTVFGDYAKAGLLVSSTKSMTGHLLGAAGAVEALFCVMALRDQFIPPTINLDSPSEGCDLDYVPHKGRSAKIEYALSNSFGFGGTNASVILKKA